MSMREDQYTFEESGEDDFEFGSHREVKNFDHLSINWLAILQADAIYLVCVGSCWLGAWFYFYHADIRRAALVAACSYVCCIFGAVLLAERAKNRWIAAGIYYSVLPSALLIAEVPARNLVWLVLNWLTLIAGCLVATLVTMSVVRVEQGELAIPTNHLPASSSDLSNGLAGEQPGKKHGIAWLAILLACVMYYLVAYLCICIFVYDFKFGIPLLFNHLGYLFAIVHTVRLLPWIVSAILLALLVRRHWLLNAVVFAMLVSIIQMFFYLNFPSVRLPEDLRWMFIGIGLVVLTVAISRLLFRIRMA